jgi:pilus assembly protein CpaB
LACAVLAGLAVFAFLRMSLPSVPVLVAARDLSPGQTLTQADLAVRRYPRMALPSDTVGAKEALGKHLRTAVAAGDPVRRAHLAEYVGGGTVAARLARYGKPDWRAVPLPASVTEGLPWVEVGDRLDLACTIDTRVPGEQGGKVTRFVVRNAPVIWSAYSESLQAKKDERRDSGPVTVALPPEDALRVLLALSSGQVKAVLAPAGEAEVGTVSGVDLKALLSGSGGVVEGGKQANESVQR